MNTELTTPERRISAATLTVPSKQPMPASEDVFERLRRLRDELGSNKNDAVTALIAACIGEGLDTEPLIVAMIGRLGFDDRHIRIMLKNGTGTRPERASWQRKPDKSYSPLT